MEQLLQPLVSRFRKISLQNQQSFVALFFPMHRSIFPPQVGSLGPVLVPGCGRKRQPDRKVATFQRLGMEFQQPFAQATLI